MCQICKGCGAKLVHSSELSADLKRKLGIKSRYDYEYCCICPNGCPDQRPPPENQDLVEMCCDCA